MTTAPAFRVTDSAYWPALFACCVAMAFDAIASAAEFPTTGKRVPGMESYDRLIPEFMEKHKLPGGAVAVVKDGRLVLARGYGYADREEKIAVEPTALFRLASVSKPITAVMVLRLVEQGKIKLDDRVFATLSEFDDPKNEQLDKRLREITVRQLLHHTGGWDRDKSFDPMFRAREAAEETGGKPPADARTVIRWMMRKPLDFAPGERFAYSNYGYNLLGRIIEKTTGRGYEEAVRAELFAGCGCARMRIGRSLAAGRVADEVRYYHSEQDDLGANVFPDEPAKKVAWPYGGFHLEAMDAHGGWLGSAVELMRFVTALDGSRRKALLKPETLALVAERPAPPLPADAPSYYGLGWTIVPSGPRACWSHGGSLPGTTTVLVRTTDGRAWAALFNSRPEGKNGKGFHRDLESLLWQAAEETKSWPQEDLFDRYPTEPAAKK